MGAGGQSGQGARGAREVDTVDTASTSRPALGSAEFWGFAGDLAVWGAGVKKKTGSLGRASDLQTRAQPLARDRVWRRGFRLGMSGNDSLAD